MDLKMEVYTPQLEFLGILEVYDALIFEDFAFKPGTFALTTTISLATKYLLVPENIIWFEGETAGIIEFIERSVEDNSTVLSVKGSLLSGLLQRRVLWGTYNLYGSVPAIMYELVSDCAINPSRGDGLKRKIPGLVLRGNPPDDTRKFRECKTGGELTSTLTELAQASQIAYGIRFNPQVPQMEFWARVGVDRTIAQKEVEPVCYSTELDDVLNAVYSYDSSHYKNLMLVAGEGEGDARKYHTVSVGKKSLRLPEGYTELAYIQTQGGAYIDTGYKPTSDTRVLADIEPTQAPVGSNYLSIFGSRDQASSVAEKQFILWATGESQLRSDYFKTNTIGAVPTVVQKLHIDKNKNITTVNGVKILNTAVSSRLESNYSMYLLQVNAAGSTIYNCPSKLYFCNIYDNEIPIRAFVPCRNAQGICGLYDLVTSAFYKNAGMGEFIGGPEVTDVVMEASGLARREAFVDARDLQSAPEGSSNPPLTEEEYIELLEARGLEKQANAQLVQSFCATVRTVDPTYEYGVDFFLGDMITVVDERLGVTVEAVVEGIERGIDKDGENFVLTLGYSMPTIFDQLRKAGV